METNVSCRQVLDLPSDLQGLQVGKVQRLLQRYRVDVVASRRRLSKTSKEVEQMNRQQRANWLSTFVNMDIDEKLTFLAGFYEALDEVVELVDELRFDTEVSDKKALKEIQKFLKEELREMKP
jgi:hypothetical protein